MLNSEKPDQIRGLDTIYSFKGSGDVSYRISFKTQGAPTARLYYAAGARSGEYKQATNYNQLYVEPYKNYRNRVQSNVQVKNRTLHLKEQSDNSILHYRELLMFLFWIVTVPEVLIRYTTH